MKVVKWFDEHFEETLLVVFLILIAFVSLLQIIARTFFGGLPWPEEFDRYCWIWTVFLSLPYTIRKGNMLRVNVLVDLFPTKVRNTINLIVDAIIFVVMLLLCRSSVIVIQNAIKSQRKSPAMQLPMYIVYLCLVLGFGLGIFRSVQMFVIHIMHFNQREKTTLEQSMDEARAETAAAQADLTEGGDN
ncbi:MAG: TRAP transporter small permease [Lachnospiraceae bacterium]|nr:TRAP transporter small permease [Lachnospiraceae bacterium]